MYRMPWPWVALPARRRGSGRLFGVALFEKNQPSRDTHAHVEDHARTSCRGHPPPPALFLHRYESRTAAMTIRGSSSSARPLTKVYTTRARVHMAHLLPASPSARRSRVLLLCDHYFAAQEIVTPHHRTSRPRRHPPRSTRPPSKAVHTFVRSRGCEPRNCRARGASMRPPRR